MSGLTPADDTGINFPETPETLCAQQDQLIHSHRRVQMFPSGTQELSLPAGLSRVETSRGVFHFNPDAISPQEICRLSAAKRENELLDLGPYNKADILERVLAGETPLIVTERTLDGIEVRAALGTPSTAPAQIAALKRSRSPGHVVSIEGVLELLLRRDRGKAFRLGILSDVDLAA